MEKGIKNILTEVLIEITPDKEEIKEMDSKINEFIKKLKGYLKRLKIKADVFVGGSFAKNTFIKKDNYDADIFLRFDKKYKDYEISDITERILKKGGEKILRIHGSRDYFSIKKTDNLHLEIIPVIKINNQKEAKNITDLSYFHVAYIIKKLNKKLIDEIRLAKAFFHACNAYGAESYIQGFSGYAVELMIIYYKNFLNMAKAITRVKIEKEKLIIDIEKKYKNKNEIMLNLNSSKLTSPVILIDPTFPSRNALASLSSETFENVREASKKFLKKPSIETFHIKGINFEEKMEKALKQKLEFTEIDITTDRQEGDIAGSKLIKFYRHLIQQAKNNFEIKDSGFEYDNKQSARVYIIAKPKKEIIFQGPEINRKENAKAFKKQHKKTFVKKRRMYAKEKNFSSLKEFLDDWQNKNFQKTMEMGINEMKVG